MTDQRIEASQLISRHLDEVLTADEESRLADLIQADSAIVELYVNMMQIHGQLSWGAGGAQHESSTVDHTSPLTQTSQPDSRRSNKSPASRWLISLAIAAVAIIGVSFTRFWQPEHQVSVTADPEKTDTVPSPSAGREPAEETSPGGDLVPLTFDSLEAMDSGIDEPVAAAAADLNESDRRKLPDDISDASVIAVINEEIATGLEENEAQPSPVASSEEWTRRAWLTVAGRIPSIAETQTALQPSEANSPTALIDRLLQSPDRSKRLAEVWTSLLVGRSERLQIDRPALQGYLYDAFRDNRSWMTVVGELISAEGRSDENGATNFLLAHLDNQATPATAVTARLFLGEHLQCVQCHDHPFATDVRQQEYWALNAFFQHTTREYSDTEPSASAMRNQVVRLTDRRATGMTFFETRSGRQEATLAGYDGHRIPADSEVPRRSVLAEYLAADSQLRVARAMVNRVWADFFGYGFTNPVDDMGPHVVVSHSALLDKLTEAFVSSGYDLQRLQRWVALSDAWQRTSQASRLNQNDSPENGTVPLFSRVYMRRMAPEQVYDSIRVAIRAVSGRESINGTGAEHRQKWVSQFVRPYNTDENDETNEFNGSVAQAMVMMNGLDINAAIRQAIESSLENTNSNFSTDSVLEQLSLAVLTRSPTSRESAIFRQQLKHVRRATGIHDALPQVTEDMLWAYLNSSEFLLIH